ncbi:helix-turn-helix transcriptional regulator [Ralstonia chuxiongensis]|uniref:helix-turn-helix transcriptional regulator n=1 Tax=Ralstonia chuxiongensis TaxID=2957504 RepID=UPI0028F59692|nr:helix-turn-helix domain-containing protein [Ralstonia chuxiongensis]CAJ0781910.1 hypothetical protein R8510_04936 [Ralstonia chuxiongensis]
MNRSSLDFLNYPPDARIGINEVAAAFGVSESTVRRRIKSKSIPHPLKDEPRLLRWRVKDIKEFLSK